MKALVISGGGSKGAFAGGISQYLIEKKKQEYDLYVGASTGSLLIPLLASNNLPKAYEVYTTIKNSDIFTLSPYKLKKRRGVEFIRMHHINVLRSFLRGNKTFGDSQNLRATISSFFSEADFTSVKNSQQDVIVTVSNLSTQEVEYKSIKDFSYDDYCDWIWASANFVPFMSLMVKNHMEYADGGFGNNVPVQVAIDKGATEIDVIILDPVQRLTNKIKSTNAFDLTFKLLDYLLEQNHQSKLEISKLRAQNKKVKINRYYTPTQLTENSLIFNKEKMQTWWKKGFAFAEKSDPKEAVIIPD
ncbi:MAG: patatin-like phospholipase family protein [Flavobacteriales bacterium]